MSDSEEFRLHVSDLVACLQADAAYNLQTIPEGPLLYERPRANHALKLMGKLTRLISDAKKVG